MNDDSKIKFCKAKFTHYHDILKKKQFEINFDEFRCSLANIPSISIENQQSDPDNNNEIILLGRKRECRINLLSMSPRRRDILLNFLEQERIYFPERKIKMFDRLFKFHDRLKPIPPFTKKILEKKKIPDLKEICKNFNVSVNNKVKAEIISAIMRYQKKGDIGKKEKCFDGMPVCLLEPLDDNGNILDNNNSDNNSSISTNTEII